MEQIPRHRMGQDDESIDELAGEALLRDIPQHITRADSLHNELTAGGPHRPMSNQSSKTMSSDLDKPLPPIPSMKRTASRDDQARPALAAKTTNLRVRRDGNACITKPKISHPILQSTTSAAVKLESRPTTGQSAETSPMLHFTSTDYTDLNQKISDLVQQAAVQEDESKRREAILTSELAKPSPRQRAKKVFVKASRALRDRLSGGSSTERSRGGRLPSASPPKLIYDTEQVRKDPKKARSGTISRHMAEGDNLNGRKTRSFMGDGNVPRKPLPVYESMRSRSRNPLEDPFSDDQHFKSRHSAQDFSGFDFDFDKHKHRAKGSRADRPLTALDQIDGATGLPGQESPIKGSRSRFTNLISGLAQHSDTMFFSSSPEATSTPHRRLDPNSAAADKAYHSTVEKSPSILEFSFEGPSDEEKSIAPSTGSKTVTDASQSVKRKNAKENLRSPTEPAAKKAKTSSRLSCDNTIDLAANLGNLDTEDERAPLSPEKRRKKHSPLRQANRKRGLGIFEVGKGKSVEAKVKEGLNGKERPKGLINKRSSFPRPGSMLFGRESRGGNRKFAKLDDDEMDVDELDTKDPKYHIGKNKE